ncbi:MAG: sigma-70 family RNA polymerase sigma factor [Phycisphaerales bacterium]|nr:MAG: sigma-70 family RNA polymerase sigma factor [Phycisphaerales bacterium]
MPERDDIALLQAAGKGDRAAFGELVQRHHRAVVHYVHRFLGIGDRATAEDIAQDVFLAAWKGAPAFTPRAAAFTWLLRIAINICLNYSRSRRRKPTVPLIGEPAAAGRSSQTSDPDTAALEEERKARLEAAVASLPPSQRSAILLRHFHDLSYSEIAAVLQTSVPAVESLLFRGRQRLKKVLERERGDA